MKKTLIRTLACIAGAAIIAAIGRAFNNDNTNMPNQLTYPMQVDRNELLTIYDITDCPLDLACGQMPDTTQENVLLCAAAAFTGQCLDHLNIAIFLAHIFRVECYTKDILRIKMGYYSQSDMRCLYGKVRD